MQSTCITFKLTLANKWNLLQTKYDADDDKIKINEIDLFGLGKAYNLLIFPYLDENYSLVYKSFEYYDENSYWRTFTENQ